MNVGNIMSTTTMTLPIRIFVSLLVLSGCIPTTASSQESVLYKKIDTTSLYMDIYLPSYWKADQQYPAIVFFFGGGWVGGSKSQFEPAARYLAERGMVCFLADYRVRNRHGTTPFESLKDARSAMRFVKKNVTRYSLDPDKIVAAGGSAGGHLAAATALIEGYDEEGEDISADVKPSALVLFNPVIDNGPGGYGYERIGEAYLSFSPLHNLREGAPPTVLFLGTLDRHIPMVTAEYYKHVMEKVGSRCDLHLYEGQQHGFFNYKNFELYRQTLLAADQFLMSLGYLSPEPVVEVK